MSKDDKLSARLAAAIGVTETELSSMVEAAKIAAAHYRPLLIEAARELRSAEAEVERLKGVLQQIGEGTRDGQHCALIANVALEAKP